jgi:hypothetical protein
MQPTGLPNDSTKPRLARRIRFSLLTLMLVAALLCTALSHVLTSIQLHRLEKETRQLRDQLGYLTITDGRRLHAIGLNSDLGWQSKRWTWKVYFPPGRGFRVCYKFTDLPAEGTPDDNYEFFDDVGGEMTLTVSVVSDPKGVWKIVLHTEPFPVESTRSQFISNATWLVDDSEMGWSDIGRDTTVSVDVGEPMILLSVRPSKSFATIGGAPATTVDRNPSNGIMVWIEEAMTRPLKPPP